MLTCQQRRLDARAGSRHRSGQGFNTLRPWRNRSFPKALRCRISITQGPHAHVQGASLKAWGHDLGRVLKPWVRVRFNTPTLARFNRSEGYVMTQAVAAHADACPELLRTYNCFAAIEEQAVAIDGMLDAMRFFVDDLADTYQARMLRTLRGEIARASAAISERAEAGCDRAAARLPPFEPCQPQRSREAV